MAARAELYQLVDQLDEVDIPEALEFLRSLACPAQTSGTDQSQPRPFTLDDPLWDIVGMIKDGPPDLSAEHDRYLAESYVDTHEE